MLDQTLPIDVELEKSVIGGVLWLGDAEFARKMTSQTPRESFYAPEHAEIWQKIEEMAAEGVCDEVFLRQSADAGTVTEVMAQEANTEPLVIEREANEIKRIAHRRGLLQTCHEAQATLINTDQLESVEADLTKSVEKYRSQFVESIGVDVSDAIAQLETMQRFLAEEKSIVPTGITTIDEDYHGYFPEYHVLLAQTSHGKTAKVLSDLAYQIMKGYRVYLHSGEQSPKIVMLKLVSIYTGLTPAQILGRAYTSNKDKDDVETAKKAIQRLPLYLTTGKLSVSKIWAKASECEPHIMYIDQFDKLEVAHYGAELKREEKMGMASKEVYDMTGDLGIPVVALAQLNLKTVKQRASATPDQSDIRDCSQIIQDADKVCLLDRPVADEQRWKGIQDWLENKSMEEKARVPEYLKREDAAQLRCTKDRNGLTGLYKVTLGFDATCGKFHNLTH